MTGWIIFGCIVGLFILLLIASVRVSFSVSDNTLFKVKYLFFTVFSFDSSKNKDTVKKDSKETTSGKKTKPKTSLKDMLKRYSKGKNKPEMILELVEFFKNLLSRLKTLIGHMRFRGFRLYLSLGTDEAAKTAVMYGAACSAIYPLVALLSSARNFSADEVIIKTDFSSDKTEFSSSGQVKIRLIHILTFLVSVAFSIIKTKIGEISNGRTQH